MCILNKQRSQSHEAINYLYTHDVIDSPDYWKEQTEKVPWLGLLFIKIVNYIKSIEGKQS